MDRKKRNILSLILSLALTCTIIPVGITRDWSIIEFIIGVASVFIAEMIVSWNNEAAFKRSPSANIHYGYHFLGYFCLVFGMQGIWECWGEGVLLKVLGAALTIVGAISFRLACRIRRNTTE